MFAIVAKYYCGDQIMQKEMGGSCDTVWMKRNARRLWWGKLKGRDYLEDPGIDVKIIIIIINMDLK